MSALALLAVFAAAAGGAEARTLFGPAVQNLTVGMLLPELSLYDTSRPELNYWRAAVQLAVADVNANPAVLPNHTVLAAFGDTKGDERYAFYAAEALVEDDGAAAVVGPVLSTLSGVTGFATSRLGVNHIDFLGTGTGFLDQAEYGFHTRLKLDVGASAAALLAVAASVGWRRLGLLVDPSDEMQSVAAELRARAPAAGVELAEVVQVAIDPSVAPGEPIGDMSLFLDRVAASRTARVWVHLVRREYSARFRVQVMARRDLEQFQWIMVDGSTFDVGEALALEASTGVPSFRRGDILMTTLAYTQDAAVVGAWGARLAARTVEGTSYAASEATVDAFVSRWAYDAVLMAAHGLDGVWRLREFCAAAANATAHANCTELAADAGNDDVTLRRVMRSRVLTAAADGIQGFPIQVSPATGARLTPTLVIQAASSSLADLRNPALFLPSGVLAPGSTDWAWAGGDGVAAAPADRPHFEAAHEEVSGGAYAAMAALCGAGLALCVACIVLSEVYRKLPIMRMSSYRLNALSAAGGCVLLGGSLAWHGALTTAVCRAQLWSLSLGFTLLFGPMFSKLWRIYKIFASNLILHNHKVTDSQLMEIVAGLLAVDALVLGVWQGVSPTVAHVESLEPAATDDAFVFVVGEHSECRSDGAWLAVPLLLGWKAALLATGSVLAFKTRKVTTRALNDSKWVGLSVYTSTLVAALAVPLAYLVDGSDPDAVFILLSGSVFLVVVASMSLLFLPKFAAIWFGTADEWTAKATHRAGHSSVASRNSLVPTGAAFKGRRTSVGSANSSFHRPQLSVPGTPTGAGSPRLTDSPPTKVVPRLAKGAAGRAPTAAVPTPPRGPSPSYTRPGRPGGLEGHSQPASPSAASRSGPLPPAARSLPPLQLAAGSTASSSSPSSPVP